MAIIYGTYWHIFYINVYNVEDVTEASDTGISSKDPSSEMLTSQSQKQEGAETESRPVSQDERLYGH